jgi:hypothetical protein
MSKEANSKVFILRYLSLDFILWLVKDLANLDKKVRYARIATNPEMPEGTGEFNR